MTIFVSDMHFGRFPGETDRDSETALVSCLSQYRDQLDGLYLVGDVFEHFVEYKHLIPKGFVRFQALLCELADSGIPVTYLAGNHDPWHIDYFESEIGVRVEMDGLNIRLHGKEVYVAHGDGLGEDVGMYKFLKPILRHKLPVGIFRSVLPADLGMRIATWYSSSFRHESPNQRRATSLQNAGLQLLDRNAYDVVVMGHSHVPTSVETPTGVYLNCGCWYQDRTLVVLDDDGPSLQQWQGSFLADYGVKGLDSTMVK